MRGPERSNSRPATGAATPAASAVNEYIETTRARSQPKLSEIGSRKTVKLSTRPRPSTDSAKQRASTLSAVRTGARDSDAVFAASEFWSMRIMERLSAAKSSGFGRIRLCRPEQDVALLAKRKLDHAFRRKMRRRQRHLLVSNGDVVDAETAALDLPPRLA